MISFTSDFGVDIVGSATEQPDEMMQLNAIEQDLRSKLRQNMEKDDVEEVKFYAGLLGRTKTALLMHACSTSSTEVALYLISAGVDINKQDTRGNTALHVACHRGDQNIVELLLNAGANVHLRNTKGYTALALTAARGDQTSMAALLLSSGAKADENCGSSEQPPLESTYRDGELISATSQEEGNMALDERHKMPLFLALKYGSTGMVELLLKAGSRVSILPAECRERLLENADDDLLGSAVTRYPSAKGKLQLLSWYTKSADLPPDTMDDASRRKVAELTKQSIQHFGEGNVLELKRLLGSGPNGRPFFDDVAHAYGPTYDEILYHAVGFNNLNTVRLLLDRGCDSNAKNDYGLTALHSASFRGYQEMIKLLLEYGANIDSNYNGETPLCHAVDWRRASCVELLLERGANVSGGGGPGDKSPLMKAIASTGVGSGGFASTSGAKEQIVEYLIQAGANVELGRPLETAILHGSARMVERLLNAGAILDQIPPWRISQLSEYAESGEQGLLFREAKKKLRLIEKKQRADAAASRTAPEETERRWIDLTVPHS
jgi:ankyrin repeat protein